MAEWLLTELPGGGLPGGKLWGLGMVKAGEALPSHAVPSPAFMQGTAHPQAATKLCNLGSGKMIQGSRAKGKFQRGKVLQSNCFEPEGKHKKMFCPQPMINIGMM